MHATRVALEVWYGIATIRFIVSGAVINSIDEVTLRVAPVLTYHHV